MKLLIASTFLFSSFVSYSQKMGETSRNFYNKYFDSIFHKPLVIGQPATPGVHYLAEDHMPCVVPDTKGISSMPNAWPSESNIYKDGRMPNPALPKEHKSKG